MISRLLPVTALAATLALAALAPASARGQGTTVAEDPHAQQVTALGGTIAWVRSTPGRPQTLMQHDAAGTRPVEGAPPARFYRSLDLGRDHRGGLVLTYLRCDTGTRCVPRRDDLEGRRSGFRNLTRPGCSLTTAPALWRERAAYGLHCRKGNVSDARRSGVYVRTGSRTPRRMPRPGDAARYGISLVDSADLRGTRVAGLMSDIYAYAFATSVNGTGMRSALVATSEGDGQQRAAGLALGAGGDLWSLTTSEHPDGPLQTVIHRQAGGDCRETEILSAAAGEESFPAVDIAVDGRRVYLATPGTGIVAHEFTPARRCS